MSRPGDLVAIVLAYGGGSRCGPLLDQLRAVHAVNGSGRTIVVHNPCRLGQRSGLTDDEYTTILENDTNVGYAEGMNNGIRASRAYSPDWILLLTHEVRLEPEAVRELVSGLAGAPAYAAVGPLMYDDRGELRHYGVMRSGCAGMRLRTSPPPWAHSRPWECNSLDGAGMLWRGHVLYALDGFQARFFMYFEETDLCARARRSGWRVGVVPSASARSSPGGAQRRQAHGYLRTRNGLQCALDEGLASFVAAVAEVIRDVWRYTPMPGGKGFADPVTRTARRAYRRGVVCGAADFARRRWGPPPPGILIESDIGAVTYEPNREQ